MKKEFKIRVRFAFAGELVIRAHDRAEAERLAESLTPTAQIGFLTPSGVMPEEITDMRKCVTGQTVIRRSEEKGGDNE